MYKIEDLQKKTIKELLELVSELKGKLLALRFENSTGQLNETHLFQVTKKDIARIFTVLSNKKNETTTTTTTKTSAKVSKPEPEPNKERENK